jgi:FAD synthetase
MQRVQVFGTFDYFHPGHEFVLTEAQKLGQLYVTVAQDATVERIKGSAPDNTLLERMNAITSAFPEAVVFAGSTTNYLDSVQMALPDLIALGYDQQLPPGITEKDLGVPTVRLEPFEPEKWKSSLLRKN